MIKWRILVIRDILNVDFFNGFFTQCSVKSHSHRLNNWSNTIGHTLERCHLTAHTVRSHFYSLEAGGNTKWLTMARGPSMKREFCNPYWIKVSFIKLSAKNIFFPWSFPNILNFNMFHSNDKFLNLKEICLKQNIIP